MNIGLEDTPELVGITTTEESNPMDLVLVYGESTLQGFHVELVVIAIDKRSNEAVVVKQVNGLRRGMNESGIACVQVIRCDELCEDRYQVEQHKDKARHHGQAVAFEFPPHQLPLRGEEKPFLFWRQSFDRQGVEWLVRDKVIQLTSTHLVAPP